MDVTSPDAVDFVCGDPIVDVTADALVLEVRGEEVRVLEELWLGD
jgi:hypothetical protein